MRPSAKSSSRTDKSAKKTGFQDLHIDDMVSGNPYAARRNLRQSNTTYSSGGASYCVMRLESFSNSQSTMVSSNL
jgi:hypothetical protein